MQRVGPCPERDSVRHCRVPWTGTEGTVSTWSMSERYGAIRCDAMPVLRGLRLGDRANSLVILLFRRNSEGLPRR